MLSLSPIRMAGFAVSTILLCFACGLIGLLKTSTPIFGGGLRDGYTDQFVPMVDPGGWNADRDLTYSQSNKNNSEANLNNAKAAKELAQATAIIRHSEYDDPLYVPKEVNSMTGEAFNRGMLAIVGLIFVFVIGFVVIGIFKKNA